MSNHKKKDSERKSYHIGMRVNKCQMQRWTNLAAVRGMTFSQLMTEAIEGLLTDPKWEKNRCIQFIKAAARIIDEKENGGNKEKEDNKKNGDNNED